MSSQALLNREIDLESLAFALARNECGAKDDVKEVLRKEGVSFDQFAKLADDKLFQQLVQKYVKELSENGVGFQLKARIQAEELLKRQWFIIQDPETPPAVAIKAIENTVRWAGLEPKTSPTGTTATPGSGFQIIFNLNHPDPKEKVIEIRESVTLEQK